MIKDILYQIIVILNVNVINHVMLWAFRLWKLQVQEKVGRLIIGGI